jgi:hypothetical protein
MHIKNNLDTPINLKIAYNLSIFMRTKISTYLTKYIHELVVRTSFGTNKYRQIVCNIQFNRRNGHCF